MPLKKLLFKAGVNRENTRYTNENGWYDCDKVRFRQGTPEKIGGWERISENTFDGVCRSLWNWSTLNSTNLISLGTNKKFYISQGGEYYDITPIRESVTLTNPFDTTNNSSTITVTDGNGGYQVGDFVTFYGSSATGNLTILGEHEILSISGNDYTIAMSSDVAITAASPAVFTASFKLANNTPVVLSTTGSLPPPFVAGTTYYVVNTSDYTFNLAATSGGTAISAIGSSQAGSHTVTAKATSTVTNGGGTVQAVYQINIGSEIAVPITGWGAGEWGFGEWGIGTTSNQALRLWSQTNFGEDLVFGPRNGKLYYWDASVGVFGTTASITIASPAVMTTGSVLTDGMAITLTTTGSLPTGLLPGVVYYVVNASGVTCNLAATAGGTPINTSGSQSGTQRISTRAIAVEDMSGASNVPLKQNYLTVSDISRFTFCFGSNDYLGTTFDPMLIRWSDQESVTNWTPSATNQAGSVRLSHGSQIVTALQSRQEILVWTDTSLYSLQYLNPPIVWGTQLLGDNLSIIGQNATALASGVAFWMGVDKFYKYDGRVQTLRCDLRKFIYSDINLDQADQIFAGTNEGFNEVWWFYCTAGSTVIDRYVVYNYVEDIWYYGDLGRTAWLDSPYQQGPLATTYINNTVIHEIGNDNKETSSTQPIEAYINSAQFDLDDGHNFSFVWRVLPDITFVGSTADSPTATMYLKPLKNSGSGYTTPPSVGGYASHSVTRTATIPIEEFTGQIYTRVRGRQMTLELRSTNIGVAWQLGSPRLDIRPDGRR
jgi:hypothetical protein